MDLPTEWRSKPRCEKFGRPRNGGAAAVNNQIQAEEQPSGVVAAAKLDTDGA